MAIQLSHLLAGFYDIPPEQDCVIQGIALDSRLIQPGDLFFAYAGTHLDGKNFIASALKNGAKIILTDAPVTDFPQVIVIKNLKQIVSQIAARFYNNPATHLNMIGVTGTNGKTSCTHFIANVLKQIQTRCGIIGTLGNGIYGHIQPGSLTTPDAITLQKLLAEFMQQDVKYVAMEVSSHSLDQDRVQSIPFKVAVFTNLSRDHLDYHGSMEAYGNAKKKLFTELAPEHCVINADDEFGRDLIQTLAPHKKVFAYGINKINPTENIEIINVDEVLLDHTGIHANVYTPWGKGELHTHLIGEFNLSNVLAILTTLCLLEVPLPVVLNGILQLKPVPGRMQTLGGKMKPLVVVDYAHSPDALEKTLIALRSHCRQTLYCVFGCGGDRDKGKRPIMAKIAEKWADRVIVTDDNPRTEDPKQIVQDIIQGFNDSGTIIVQHDRAEAIRSVIHKAQPGDCILIAGKGAEMYQQIGDAKIPFNDAEEVNKSLLGVS